MDESPNMKKRSRSTQLESLPQNVNETTGGKYRNEGSAFLRSSFSIEYCNFITAEHDKDIEDSNVVEQNEEVNYLMDSWMLVI